MGGEQPDQGNEVALNQRIEPAPTVCLGEFQARAQQDRGGAAVVKQCEARLRQRDRQLSSGKQDCRDGRDHHGGEMPLAPHRNERPVLSARIPLGKAQEQSVQIAAAVGTQARVLVFDEPTASLSSHESEQLFQLMAKLKQDGITMIYVSHRMPEVLALCDSISVLRDGKFVGSLTRATASHERLVEMMTGRVVDIRRTGGSRPAAAA